MAFLVPIKTNPIRPLVIAVPKHLAASIKPRFEPSERDDDDIDLQSSRAIDNEQEEILAAS